MARRTSATSGADYVLCPYYIAESAKHQGNGGREIICRGLIPDARDCVRFRTPAQKEFHKHTFCEGCYRRCERYISITHWLWDEDED